MADEYISIGEAAELMEVSIMTLRRWDESGKFKAAVRTEGAHRLYRREDVEVFLNNLGTLAYEWVSTIEALEIPNNLYCQVSPIFQSRLGKMQALLQTDNSITNIVSLIVAVTGEIGNNSFDHNIGNWPDVPGIFFGFDIQKRQVVLADRGQGILQTLKRVRPELNTHDESLRVAFTEIISGREPEARGNGLKFVRKITQDYPINLVFQTGDSKLQLNGRDGALNFTNSLPSIKGCLALITY